MQDTHSTCVCLSVSLVFLLFTSSCLHPITLSKQYSPTLSCWLGQESTASKSCLLTGHPRLLPLQLYSSQSPRYNSWQIKWLLLCLVNYSYTCLNYIYLYRQSGAPGCTVVLLTVSRDGEGSIKVATCMQRQRRSSTLAKVGECQELADKSPLLFIALPLGFIALPLGFIEVRQTKHKTCDLALSFVISFLWLLHYWRGPFWRGLDLYVRQLLTKSALWSSSDTPFCACFYAWQYSI